MVLVEAGPFWLTRFCIQRFLGLIYFIAFLVTLNQFRALIGEHGLLPVRNYLQRSNFWGAPSLFWINNSDRFLTLIAWGGLALSFLAMTGLADSFGMFLSVTVWLLLWLFYFSFVNVGQFFYGFGSEAVLLETGFLAIFLGSSNTSPPTLVIWLLRWLLFRVMFHSGLVKIRGDSCWRDLTCLFYHYETQPLPNPLSWYFHHLPRFVHKAGILFTHFVELVVPWGFFAPRLVCYAAGIFTAVFQILLILSGNLSWLNYLILVLCISCFDDAFLGRWVPLHSPAVGPISEIRQVVLIMLTVFILTLSVKAVLDRLFHRKMMNISFARLYLGHAFGAFDSITKERNEIVLEGTDDPVITPATPWREYEFKAKPGRVDRVPPVVSPYNYRLDWLMWYAAMPEYRSHPLVARLIKKILEGDREILKLLANNPFPDAPPRHIRASLYRYHFSRPQTRKKTGEWWTRTRLFDYLPLLSND